MLTCHYINSNQLIAIFLLGGDVYRIIDKRANKTEGNADHRTLVMKVVKKHGKRMRMMVMMIMVSIIT